MHGAVRAPTPAHGRLVGLSGWRESRPGGRTGPVIRRARSGARWPSRQGLMDGSDPRRRGAWACPCPPSPTPIEACRDGGSLPSTSEERGSASALRRSWRNRKRASDIGGRGRVRPNGDFVSGDPQSEPDTQESPPEPASGGHYRPRDSPSRSQCREVVDRRFGGCRPGARRAARGRARGPQPRVRRLRAGRRGDRCRRMGRAVCGTRPGNPATPGRARATGWGFPARPFTSMNRKRPAPPSRTPLPGTVRGVSSEAPAAAAISGVRGGTAPRQPPPGTHGVWPQGVSWLTHLSPLRTLVRAGDGSV